ncbi:MAG: response regulator [Planctomycetota bacterium]|jgi:DNA-binding NarL/FixJ family response regulator
MRILIADDHGIVREGLKSLLGEQSDMEVVGEGEDGQMAVQLAKELSPDIVIMDMSMPNLNGVEATRLILQHSPNTRVIILSMHSDRNIVKEALEAGASAYVLKSYLFDEMLRALEAVAKGRRHLSPRITDVVIDDYVGKATGGESAKTPRLTGRERQIVQLVAEGKSVKEIARVLHVSPKTADTNRRQIMNKLGFSSVSELTKYALREGLTSLEF